MSGHLRALHLILKVAGSLGLVVLLLVMAIGVADLMWSEQEPMPLASSLLEYAQLILCLTAIPHLIAARAIERGRPWARPFTMAVAVVDLIAVPVGTLLGAYALWVMRAPLTPPRSVE